MFQMTLIMGPTGDDDDDDDDGVRRRRRALAKKDKLGELNM